MKLPKGAKVLRADIQRKRPFIWCEVDPDETEMTDRSFRLVGTGWRIPTTQINYIDTITEGDYVWHLYEDHTPPAVWQERCKLCGEKTNDDHKHH